MNRLPQPPAPRRFSPYAFFYKGVFLYLLLMPPATAAVFMFFPRMPDPKRMMAEAGPLALLLLARTALIQGSMLAVPAAVVLAFLRAKLIMWALLMLYVTLVGTWVLKLMS